MTGTFVAPTGSIPPALTIFVVQENTGAPHPYILEKLTLKLLNPRGLDP